MCLSEQQPPKDWFQQCIKSPSPKKKHALILCNGQRPSLALLRGHLGDAQLFIAADGGALTAAHHGFRPDIVVGDLDSYEKSRFENLKILHRPDQETNDLEKALDYALGEGMESALILGATGLRLDHTLKNLSVLKRYQDRLVLWIEDDIQKIWLCRRGSVIRGFPGQALSLFPLSGKVKGIWTSGLQYPLRGETLENGRRDGTSNALLETRAYVWVGEGDLLLLLVHPSVLENEHEKT